MDEIMEMLHDYVTMLARVTAGDPLSSIDRARWLALSQILRGNGAPPEPRDYNPEECGMPVQLTSSGGFESAHLVAATRDGMRLLLEHPLTTGTLTVVRVITPRSGLEYTFPCKVIWSDNEGIGLAFDGAPGRASLGSALLVGWKRPLDLRTGWGARPPTSVA